MFPSEEGTVDEPAKLTVWLKQRKETWTQARDALWNSRVNQAVHHNRRHTDVQVTEDSLVLLDSGDWRGRHSGGVDKLKEKFEGPYRVVRVFNGGQSCELDLLPSDKRHRVFNVSKIKPFVGLGGDEGRGAIRQK